MRKPSFISIASLLILAVFASGLYVWFRHSDATRSNRLIHEKSPYLQQHAYNPVDWYPWGQEAFDKARREDKPIFLSSGYSTCHWCHVMKRECFEDPAIAATLNEHFVNIKLDREERPDVDRLYMTFVMATTGQGGWPLNVWLTPDLKPFFGGTYFPPEDRPGMPGLPTVMKHIVHAWTHERPQVEEQAGHIVRALSEFALFGRGEEREVDEMITAAFGLVAEQYDPENGGFGRAPRFPQPSLLDFLMRLHAREPDTDRGGEALSMSLTTLRHMARGGIRDHIGGGFHRYAADIAWRLPHFEKMLYDQAQLATLYLQAYQITTDPLYADIARETLDYVLRDLRDPGGGFHSAQDAESADPQTGQPAEGAYYIWRHDELQDRLAGDAEWFAYMYGATADGNVTAEEDPSGHLAGRNILYQRRSVVETASRFDLDVDELNRRLALHKQRLFEARRDRPGPHRDDKIITGWNGLMISALAQGYRALGDRAYLEAAEAAARFIRDHLYDEDQDILLRMYRDGAGEVEGFLDDYAFLIQGLLDLYDAGFDVQWLDWAGRLQDTQDRLFWDHDHGGYFATTGRDPNLLIRLKEDFDGAEPSGNGVTALNLLRRASLLDDASADQRARAILRAFGGHMDVSPVSMPRLIVAAMAASVPSRQIIIAGAPGSADTQALLAVARERFMPFSVSALADGGAGQRWLSRYNPVYDAMTALEGRATAYVCENYVCQLPVHTPDDLAQILDGI